MKIVILITDGFSIDPKAAEEAAEKLKNDGALIYAAFIGTDSKAIDHLNILADDPSHVSPLDSFANLKTELFRKIGKAIQRQVRCQFEEACRFNDTSYQHCTHDWYRPRNGNETCTNRPPPPSQISLTCQNADDCHEMCDKLWPLGKWPCPSNDTGQIMQWNRTEPMRMEHKAVLDWCPTTIDVKCGEKPTTATTTMTTTSDIFQRFPIEPEKEGEEGFPWWAIGVACALVVLAAIMVIVVVRAKKKKQNPTSVKKGKQSQQSSSGPSTKSSATQDHSPHTGKSTDGKSVALWHNMKKGGVDKSVGVSLRNTTMMVGPTGKKTAPHRRRPEPNRAWACRKLQE